MENNVITIECIPMSTAMVDGCTYAICILQSSGWKNTRLQAFNLATYEGWQGDFNPTKFCKIDVAYEDVNKVIITEQGTVHIPIGLSWPQLVSDNPKLFPSRGLLLSISTNPYRAISKAQDQIKDRVIKLLFDEFYKYQEGKLASLDKLLDAPVTLLRSYVGIYDHISQSTVSLREEIQKRNIKRSAHLGYKPARIEVNIPELKDKHLSGHITVELVKEDGYYIVKSTVSYREVLGDRTLSDDTYILTYSNQAGTYTSLKDVLAMNAPYELEVLHSV